MQKITGDNAALIDTNKSVVYYYNTSLCFNTTLNTNFTGTFDKDNVINLTLSIVGYYPENAAATFSRDYVNNSTSNNFSIEYDNASHNLNVCIKDIDDVSIYTRLYRSESAGHLDIYYNVPNKS